MEVSITKSMYDYATSWPEKKYKTISPSSLGGCMRAHYYKLKGIGFTTPPNPGALLNFELGRMWEAQVRSGLRHAGVPFIEQFYLYDEKLNTGGTLDFAIYYPETNDWEIVDSKTESVYASGYRKRSKESFVNSHKEYAMQLDTYALLLERKGFKVRNKARFVLITKDNGFLDEPVVVLSDQLRKVTLNRIKLLNKCLKSGEVPPCECEGWKQGYCNFGNPATQEPNSKKKLVNTECCGLPAQIEEWRKASESLR